MFQLEALARSTLGDNLDCIPASAVGVETGTGSSSQANSGSARRKWGEWIPAGNRARSRPLSPRWKRSVREAAGILEKNRDLMNEKGTGNNFVTGVGEPQIVKPQCGRVQLQKITRVSVPNTGAR